MVYGGLAGELISLSPGALIFNQQRVDYLGRWIAHQNPLALLAMQRKLFRLGDLTHAVIQLRTRSKTCGRPSRPTKRTCRQAKSYCCQVASGLCYHTSARQRAML